MAKALKVGERVTVNKPVEFGKRSPERANGLESIQVGDIGTVIGTTDTRSMRVEFNGVETILSAQRLERPGKGIGVRKNSKQRQPTSGMINFASTEFIREVANKLLMGGNADKQQSISIEINLTDLPSEIQDQIRSLIRAKLDLDAPVSIAPVTEPQRRKPGRPPGKKAKPVKGKKRGPKPKKAQSEPESLENQP